MTARVAARIAAPLADLGDAWDGVDAGALGGAR